MAARVLFNPATKIISVTQVPVGGIVDIDVKIDLYSDGKEDWKTDATLTKFRFPIRAVGGNPLPGNKKLGSTFFLLYGWKIRPYEASHTLNVNGNLYSEDGSSPYVSTVGVFNVAIVSSVSTLVVDGGSGLSAGQAAELTAAAAKPSAADNATAILAAAATTPIAANAKKMNGATILGTGIPTDLWRG